MPLSAGTLPAIIPERVVPFDVSTAFANGQTLTATGYVNAIQAQVDLGNGRVEGYWVLDISNLKVSATDESYKFYLLGSNDVAFGNGNVDLLAARDFAAVTGGRLVPTISAPTPTIPMTGRSSTRHVIPYSNFIGGFVFRYIQCYVVIAGTSPTVTCASWLTYDSAC